VTALVQTVLEWDGAVSSFWQNLRWEPLTIAFVIASMWWVKWPLIVVIGSACDAKRRCLPRATAAAVLAVTTAALVVTVLKDFFDRARPPVADSSLDPIGVVPASASFPSGHAATAFAAAVAVALVYPRLGRPLLALAVVIAISRVYLGVHYALDVAAGTLLGIAIGAAAAGVIRWAAPVPTARAASPAPS
jgi:undecaprenyl-diphosphatase